MAEYIEKGAFISHEESIYCKDCHSRKNSNGKIVYAIGDAPCRACGIMDVLGDVDDYPAADAMEVRHGRWRDTGSGQECAICKEIQYGYDTGRHYCPNCGAKMDGGQDDGI